MLDLTSFGLGFAVAPVAYLIFGAAAYSLFCAGKRLASCAGGRPSAALTAGDGALGRGRLFVAPGRG
jgi:hypothetical protein